MSNSMPRRPRAGLATEQEARAEACPRKSSDCLGDGRRRSSRFVPFPSPTSVARQAMSASNSPVDSSSSETPPEIPASFPAETTEVEDPFVAEDKVVESSEPAPLPSSLPSKSRPATVEDAQDSDNDDAQPVSIAAKTAEEIEDEISRKIAAMEGEGAQQQPPPPAAHSWQAVWSPAQNSQYRHLRSVFTTTSHI